MAHAGSVFGAGSEFHEGYALGDHIGSAGAYDVYAQDLVGFLVGQHFYHTVEVHARAGATEGTEREFAGLVRCAGFF
jgi:hypothetical protein